MHFLNRLNLAKCTFEVVIPLTSIHLLPIANHFVRDPLLELMSVKFCRSVSRYVQGVTYRHVDDDST